MFPQSYATFDDIQNTLPDVDIRTDEYQTLLTALVAKASRMIDSYFKRKPGAFYVLSDETRYFTGSGEASQWIGELATTPTSVSVAESGVLTSYTAWAVTDYLLWPYNAALEGKPYTRLDIDTINGSKSLWYAYPKAVKVVGKFGFSVTTPDEIAEATIIQTMRWFKRGQQAFQDTGAIMELGQLRYTQQLDPDVKQILSAPKFQRVTI